MPRSSQDCHDFGPSALSVGWNHTERPQKPVKLTNQALLVCARWPLACVEASIGGRNDVGPGCLIGRCVLWGD